MNAFHRGWYHFWQFLIFLSLWIPFRLKCYGLQNVPTTGGGLLVSNHASNLDPPLVGSPISHRCPHYFAKTELFKFIPLGLFIKSMNAYPVRRGGVDRTAMKKAVDVMRAGHLLLAFPEGTRSHDGNLQPAKPGVAMMAIQAGVPCIPVYVKGSYRAWPRDRKFPRLTPIQVFYGKPFDLPPRSEGMTSREHYQLCADEMMARIDAIRQQTEARTHTKGSEIQ